MRSYAVSIPGEVAGSPELGDALRSHDLRNIEFSDGVAPHSGMTARYVKGLEELQKKGILRSGVCICLSILSHYGNSHRRTKPRGGKRSA